MRNIVWMCIAAVAPALSLHGQSDRRMGTELPDARALMRFPVVGSARGSASGDLPPQVDLSERMPPPGDQGMTNTCAGWAVGYALCSAIRAELTGDTLLRTEAAGMDKLFSPSYIYAHALRGRPCGSDVYLSDALNVADSLGCSSWMDMPFDTARVGSACKEVPAKAEESASLFRLHGIERIGDAAVVGVRQALANGRLVVINANVEDSFVREGNNAGGRSPFVWLPTGFDNTFGHAMVIMGYDDDDRTFLVQNSWGVGWGFQGTFRMPYLVHGKYVSEAYAVDATVRLVPLHPPAAPSDTTRRTANRITAALSPGGSVTQHRLRLTALHVGPDAQEVLLLAEDADDGRDLHHLRIAVGGSRTIHHAGSAYTLRHRRGAAGATEAGVRLHVRRTDRDPELRRSLRRVRRLGGA